MLIQTVINVAVLVYFSVSSGHGIDFDFHAGMKAAAKTEEKVVLRESSLSEKCGLDLESVIRPDQEIVTLQSSASGLKSALAMGEQVKKKTPEKLPVASQWKDKFVLIWDGDKGVYFDGMYYRSQDGDFFIGDRELAPNPVKCILLSATEGGKDDACRDSCEPDSPGRTQSCIPEYRESPITKQTPEKPPIATQWTNRFELIWNGDGGEGFYFDGRYFPVTYEPDPWHWGNNRVYGEPVKCILLTPTEHGVDSRGHAEDRNGPSAPGEEKVSYPDLFSSPVTPVFSFFAAFGH